eukprot:5374991-Amphidinium_carterae.1
MLMLAASVSAGLSGRPSGVCGFSACTHFRYQPPSRYFQNNGDMSQFSHSRGVEAADASYPGRHLE